MSEAEIKAYLASIGAKGGSTKGPSKRRGDVAYYKRISKKAAMARAAKARTTEQATKAANARWAKKRKEAF